MFGTPRRNNPLVMGGDFQDYYEDFAKLLEMLDTGTIPSLWPTYRRGGSPRHWSTTGWNDYVDPSGFVQIGCYRDIPEFPTGENVVEVPFPARFSGKPLVFVQPANTSGSTPWVTWRVDAWANYNFWITWASGGGLSWIEFFWLAIGPGGG